MEGGEGLVISIVFQAAGWKAGIESRGRKWDEKRG
jgi:hypothetical protein